MRSIYLLLLLIFLPGCHSRSQRFIDGLHNYRGDGVIEEHTVHSLANVYPGFRLTLPFIDPARDHEAIYNLGHLPPTKDGTLAFYLQVDPSIDVRELVQTLDLSFDLRDEKGEIVYQHSGLSEYSQSDGEIVTFHARLFHIQEGISYTLRLSCSTKDSTFKRRIRLIIRGGGFI